ncbi:MAG: hypothetical protein JWO94_601 [Verrucomicrobiaceae bacterium]|nr:hypothetical protein [Verrucomicrobiaceae bacterium]
MSNEAPQGPEPVSPPDARTTLQEVLPPASREWAMRQELVRARQRLRQLVVIAILAVLTITCLAGKLFQLQHKSRLSPAGAADIEAERRDVEREKDRLYVDSMASATEDTVRKREAAVREVLERQRPAAGARDRRGWEWFYADTLLNQGTSEVIVAERPLRAMAVSADEKIVAAGGDDGQISLWSTDSLESRGAWDSRGGAVHGLSWSSKGLLAAALDDGSVAVWETTPPHETSRWKAHEKQVTSVKWRGNVLVSGGIDGNISTWKPTGEPMHSSQCKGPVIAMDLQPDSDAMVVILGSPERLVFGKPATIGQAHELPLAADCSALAWQPAGGSLVLSMHKIPVHLWNPHTGTGSQCLTTELIPRATAFAWSPSGQVTAIGCVNGSIVLHNPWDGSSSLNKLCAHVGPVSGLVWLKHRDRLLSIGADCTLRAWDDARRPANEESFQLSCTVSAAQWNPVQDLLAVILSDDEVQVLNGTTKEVIWSHALPRPPNLNVPLCKAALAWSPDGRMLAAGCAGRALTLWNTADGMRAGNIGDVAAEEVSWMPDGQRMLVKDASDWRTLSPDGTTTKINTPPGTAWVMPFADGRMVAVSSDGQEVRLEALGDTAPQIPMPALRMNSHIGCMAANASHTMMALGGENGAVAWFDFHAGQWVRPSLGHSGPVVALAWSADGSRLASFGADGVCRLFHVPQAAQTWMLNFHTNPEIAGTGWNARGNKLMVACSSENQIRTFDAGRSMDRELGHEPPGPVRRQPLTDAFAAIECDPVDESGWSSLKRLLKPAPAAGKNAEQDLLFAAASLGEMAVFQPSGPSPALPAGPVTIWKGKPVPVALQILECGVLGQWNAALALCEKPQGSPEKMAWLRLARAETLQRLGHDEEAGKGWLESWQAQRSAWVGDAEQTEPLYTDPVTGGHPSLAPWSCVALDDDWAGGEQNNLAALPHNLLPQPGFAFATGSFIQMAGKTLRSTSQHMFPRVTDWMPLGKPARRVAFLVAAACYTPYGAPPETLKTGTCIGSIYLRCENGTAVRVPLLYGVNVWDWWLPITGALPPLERIAWKGSNSKAAKSDHSLALYRLEWNAGAGNAAATDFSVASTMRKPAPMILAAEGLHQP